MESATIEDAGEGAGPLDALIRNTTNMTSTSRFAGATFNEGDLPAEDEEYQGPWAQGGPW